MGQLYFSIIGCVFFLSSPSLATGPQDAPVGFKDPVLLGRVMKGEAVIQEPIGTQTEFQTVVRLYFNRVSPEAYAILATNHRVYPTMFDEVKEGRTTKANVGLTEFDYWLDLLVGTGILEDHVYPEGHQTFTPAADTKSEALIVNHLTNYQDTIQSAVQRTRLIPYETGMLVEDDIHILMQDASLSSRIVKKKLHDFFVKYVSALRVALHGEI
jgi:hypothetical protein